LLPHFGSLSKVFQQFEKYAASYCTLHAVERKDGFVYALKVTV
jgi:hypothetical protein